MPAKAKTSRQVTAAAKSGRAPARNGSALPCTAMQTAAKGKRAQTSAKASPPPQNASYDVTDMARILRPAAAARWMMPNLANLTPQYVENILRGMLMGDHVRGWQLFDLMLDTWPELAAVCQELIEGVMRSNLTFQPFCEEGEKPTPKAIEKQKLVSAALKSMRPEPGEDANDLDGTLKDLLDGWVRCVTALEIEWCHRDCGSVGTIIAPRCTWWAHPVNFGWDNNGGALGLRTGSDQFAYTSPAPGVAITPFPPNKFLIGIHKSKSGPALGASLLRPLAWWWCAANFASDWLLNLAQLFGIPFRWATYDPNSPQAVKDAIGQMLQEMGSAAYGMFPIGSKLEMLEAGKSGENSPQGDILDRADRYARLLILGQTLSGGQSASKGGGKAFGTVEMEVKQARMESAAKYVCGILNHQLIPAVLELNYGETTEAPVASLTAEMDSGYEEAQRDQILSQIMPLSIAGLRQKYEMPEPQDDADSTKPANAAQPAGEDPVLKREIAYAEWRASQKAAGLSTANPPANVAPPTDAQSKRGTGGPPVSSEESDLAAKLMEIAEIADDAIFAKELSALVDEIGHWATINGHPVYLKGPAGNDSTGNEKTAKKGQGNDRKSSTLTSSGNNDGGSDTRAGRSARDVLEGDERASDEQGHDIYQRFRRQDDSVYKLWEKNRDLRREPNPSLHLGTGSEHIVERFGPDRVLKHSKGYGVSLDLKDGKIRMRDGTPLEYLQRMEAHNKVFGDNMRVEGFTNANHQLGFASSQKFIKGSYPSHQETEDFMSKAGFKKVSADAISNAHVSDKTWYHAESGYLVSDVKPDNFVKTSKNTIVPIDVIVQHHPASSEMGRHLTAHL